VSTKGYKSGKIPRGSDRDTTAARPASTHACPCHAIKLNGALSCSFDQHLTCCSLQL